jgi:hypothetical protein
MSILSEASDAVAQASLPAHLIWRGGDDSAASPVPLNSLDSAPAAGIQPVSHRGSPRIAADPSRSRPMATTIYLRHRLEACATEEHLAQCSLDYSVLDLSSFDYPQPLGRAQAHLAGASPLNAQNLPLSPVIATELPVISHLKPA